MSKGDRGAIFAIGLVAGLALAVLFFLWAFPWFSEPSQSSHYCQAGNQEHAQYCQNGDDTHFWVRPFYGWIYAEDTLAQWLMACFSIVATIVSLFAVLLLNDTLKATREMADKAEDATEAAREATRETSRMGKAQIRAYVGICDLKGTIFPEAVSPCIAVTAFIQNSGNSPARQISYRARLVRINERGKRVVTTQSVIYDDPADLAQGEKRLFFDRVLELNSEVIASIKRTNESLFFEGSIKYETVFDRRKRGTGDLGGGWTPSTTFSYGLRWFPRNTTGEIVFFRTKDGNHAN